MTAERSQDTGRPVRSDSARAQTEKDTPAPTAQGRETDRPPMASNSNTVAGADSAIAQQKPTSASAHGVQSTTGQQTSLPLEREPSAGPRGAADRNEPYPQGDKTTTASVGSNPNQSVKTMSTGDSSETTITTQPKHVSQDPSPPSQSTTHQSTSERSGDTRNAISSAPAYTPSPVQAATSPGERSVAQSGESMANSPADSSNSSYSSPSSPNSSFQDSEEKNTREDFSRTNAAPGGGSENEEINHQEPRISKP